MATTVKTKPDILQDLSRCLEAERERVLRDYMWEKIARDTNELFNRILG